MHISRGSRYCFLLFPSFLHAVTGILLLTLLHAIACLLLLTIAVAYFCLLTLSLLLTVAYCSLLLAVTVAVIVAIVVTASCDMVESQEPQCKVRLQT